MTATSSTATPNTNNSTQGEGCAGAQSHTAEPNASSAAAAAPVFLAAANGYLAAAELALQLNLPSLATRLLDLAAGEVSTYAYRTAHLAPWCH